MKQHEVFGSGTQFRVIGVEGVWKRTTGDETPQGWVQMEKIECHKKILPINCSVFQVPSKGFDVVLPVLWFTRDKMWRDCRQRDEFGGYYQS